MTQFVHLHVHSQYSLLDGQASIPALVDKAIADGMPGLALTDHGNMFGIKEFFNYVEKKNGKIKGSIKDLEKQLADAVRNEDEEKKSELEGEIAALKTKIFKPIFGCEMYVANDRLTTHTDKKTLAVTLSCLQRTRQAIKI